MTKLCDLLPDIPEPRHYGYQLIQCDYCKGCYYPDGWDSQAGMFKMRCHDCGAVVWMTTEQATCGPPMMGDFL